MEDWCSLGKRRVREKFLLFELHGYRPCCPCLGYTGYAVRSRTALRLSRTVVLPSPASTPNAKNGTNGRGHATVAEPVGV